MDLKKKNVLQPKECDRSVMSVREQSKGRRLVRQTVVFSHDEFEGRVTRPGASQRGDAETEKTFRAGLHGVCLKCRCGQNTDLFMFAS